ncbi:MAG: hypothetical protein ABIS39_03705 [Sphingomicrobium sp.]
MKSIIVAGALLAASPAIGQDSSYKPGTVWESSYIKVLPGQFENYMDYLATSWKKVQELGKREGAVVDYHVLSTNNARQGEPDLILIVEYRDYRTTAQQEALRKKVNAMLAQDDRTAGAASAARGPMRELLGSREYQELKLK